MSYINELELGLNLSKVRPGQPPTRLHEKLGSVKMKRFLEAITLMEMSLEDAAFYVGVDPNEVEALMDHPDVREYVARYIRVTQQAHRITRMRVVGQLLDARSQARMLGDAASQVAVAREMAKLEGLYAPEKREVSLSKDARKVQRSMDSYDDATLARIAAGEVIEGEFEEVDDD